MSDISKHQDRQPLAPAIAMSPCESSQLSQYGYDPATQTLALRFKGGGKLYHYSNVTPELFEDFQKADSKGSWFYANIRNAVDAFPYRKIDEDKKQQQQRD